MSSLPEESRDRGQPDKPPTLLAPRGLFGLAAGMPKNIYRPSVWQFGPAAFSEIFVPLGCIHLFQAVDRWGRHLFGEIWSGAEIHARDLSSIVSPIHSVGYERIPEKQAHQFLVPADGNYRAVTTEGWGYFQSEAEAQRAWQAQQPKLVDMYQKEMHARGRFKLAVQSLRKFLHANHFGACIIDPRTGVQFPVAPYHWGSDACIATFELRDAGENGQRPVPRINQVPSIAGPNVTHQQGYVLIFETEFAAFLAVGEAASAPAEPAAIDDGQSERSGGRTKSKGGRPKLYDADALIREIVRRANLDGLPEKRAELQRQLAQWCVDNWGSEPSDSQMREYLRRWTPYD